MMKKIIMTGATGAIGMALVMRASKRGDTVTAIVRPGSERANRIAGLEGVRIVECDISCLMSISRHLIGCEYDLFYHLAWDSSRDHYNVNRHLSNIKGTIDAIGLAKMAGCKCFVGAGSQAEYGRVDGKISENTPTQPETAYGICKYAAGLLGKIECERLGIRFVWPRIFSVYGPGDHDTTMIMSVARCLINHGNPKLTAGEQYWDYLYSEDAAEALELLGEKVSCIGTYCIASGKSRYLREYVEELRNAVDPTLKLEFGKKEYANNQVMNLNVSIDKLCSETNFMPSTSFYDGIRETIGWIRREADDHKKLQS